jgi:hypothetical protein
MLSHCTFYKRLHLLVVTFISQKDCRGAFLGDEVVFEMSDDGESGIVIGVLKEGFNPSERAFACRVEPENTGLLIPVDEGVCKMYNVITRHLTFQIQLRPQEMLHDNLSD